MQELSAGELRRVVNAINNAIVTVFVEGDKYLDSDVVFEVKDSLIRPLQNQTAGVAPDGREIGCDYACLAYEFALSPIGNAK